MSTITGSLPGKLLFSKTGLKPRFGSKGAQIDFSSIISEEIDCGSGDKSTTVDTQDTLFGITRFISTKKKEIT